MLPFQNRKKVLLSGWALLFLILFVGVSGNNNAWAESEGIEHRHKIFLFGGASQEDSEIDGSLGLGYEYRFTELFGIAGMAEFTGGEIERAMAFGIGATVHPYKGLYFLIGPGFEVVDPEHEDREELFLFRIGVGYDFELTPRWSLAPEFNVDFVSGGETTLVYGLVLGYAF
jgi:hypothetical protein